MKKIVPNVNEEILIKTAKLCKEKGIKIPTFAELKNPHSIDKNIKDKLKKINMQEVNPLNLYRINWKNNIETGEFGDVNFLEIPSSITGVKARIVGIIGKHFPTNAHKVGAAFGCLVPRLVSGNFDPTTQKAVWPSTGNYCRGGAYDCAVLGCTPVAVLPEDMSKERFIWLKEIGAEVIATPGSESNVKEIYDKCWDIRHNRKDCVIFNQFEEFGNPMWHYALTGSALEEVFNKIKTNKSKFSAYVSATGSAGTIGAGEYLKKIFPNMKIVASEALQCPTIYNNGFGAHRIEGIGDKHIPWIHNVRNTDMITAIDDENCMKILRLFNEKAGLEILKTLELSDDFLKKLSLLGISSISNMISAIKTAKYYELNENDIIFTVFTDSAAMYESRISELEKERGLYTSTQAWCTYERCLLGLTTDYVKELNYYDKKAVHNLKYFTWVEQQGKTAEELDELWQPETWDNIFSEITEWDKLIENFNKY